MFDSGSGSDANVNIGFFKIISKDHLQQEEFMIIPSDFERNYGITLSNPIFLGIPNGIKWKIYWMRHKGDIWFQQSDWKRFAYDWSLRYPDFLVFKYEGESHFEVRKFDPCNTCDINYSNIKCTNDHTPNHHDEVESDDCVKIPRSCKKRKTDTNRERRTKGAPSRKKSDKTKINVGFDATRQRGSGGLSRYAGSRRACSKAQAILIKQKKRALDRATNSKTKNPSFTCTMRPSYVQRDILVIPREFAKEYLDGFKGIATIGVPEEKTWPVKINSNKCSNQTYITNGWISFCQEYKLDVDDVCKFERTQCTPLSFKISFPDREDPEELQGYGHEANRKNQDKGQRRPIQNTERGKRKRSEGISRSCPKTDDLGDSESPNNMNENKFKIRIKSNHVQDGCPYIPMAFLRKHPRCHGKYVELQVGEMSWSVKVAYYTGKHSFGRFSGGWIAFARECKLKVGNICVFDMIDEEKLVLKVSISRHSH